MRLEAKATTDHLQMEKVWLREMCRFMDDKAASQPQARTRMKIKGVRALKS